MPRQTPAKGLPRIQTQDDRDVSGLAAKKKREATPPAGVVIAESFEEDLTGQYDRGEIDFEKLQAGRKRRPPQDTAGRVDKLETRMDTFSGQLTKIDKVVAVQAAKSDDRDEAVVELRENVKLLLDHSLKDKQLDLHLDATIREADGKARIEERTAKVKDEIHKVQSRREWVTKALGLAAGAVALATAAFAAGRC